MVEQWSATHTHIHKKMMIKNAQAIIMPLGKSHIEPESCGFSVRKSVRGTHFATSMPSEVHECPKLDHPELLNIEGMAIVYITHVQAECICLRPLPLLSHPLVNHWSAAPRDVSTAGAEFATRRRPAGCFFWSWWDYAH